MIDVWDEYRLKGVGPTTLQSVSNAIEVRCGVPHFTDIVLTIDFIG